MTPPTEPVTATHHCDECGLDFLYDPKSHVCRSKGDPDVLAAVERARGESWVEECMRRQRGDKS